ncbi:MAG: hypothetical protein AAGA68_26190 [Pseudomonadota bacterium]
MAFYAASYLMPVLTATWAVVIVPLLIGFAFYLAISTLMLRSSTTYGRTQNWEPVVRLLVQRAKRGFSANSETEVIALDDDVWRQAVTLLLESADAVVVDITDLRPNLQWELEEAYRRLPAESIVLCWEESIAENNSTKKREQRIPERHADVLGNAITDGRWQRSHVSTYPPPGKDSRLFWGLTEMGLSLSIAYAIAAYPPPDINAFGKGD